MATFCPQCRRERGSDGALHYCEICLKYTVKYYCLEISPSIFQHDVIWLCDDCQSEIKKRAAMEESCTPLREEITEPVQYTQDLKQNTPLERLGKKRRRRTKNWKWTRVKSRRKKKMLKPRTEKEEEGGQLVERERSLQKR